MFPWWDHDLYSQLGSISLEWREPLRVHGRKRLTELAARHADVRSQVQAWFWEVEEAQWKGSQDVKQRYPNASLLPENRVVFNLKGNKYRLLVKVGYEQQIVLILAAGTHAEYSKWKL